ncbi:hypothetical protein QDR25_07190 [Acinetobacter baumannii]|uniref:hypothetical protein n=1 Tax=Acinetobacter baumannii TaxID=470 RepID=UPI0024497F3B|nr:hypothetical protein [Acinetobacter baumannii]MDH2480846.1 hypothetical protein [Acinetobacter baumannii]MDH2501905.1 hypothetical protein [Acinetobacter baumannii]
MGRFYFSDTEYTGTDILPTILDFLEPEGQVDFLRDILAAENKPLTLVDLNNVGYIAPNYSKYESYVLSDKGVIGSPASVIEALAFAYSQSIAYEDFSAFSAKFGYKLSGKFVSKIYGLGATNDLTVNIADSVELATDSGRKVLNFVGASAAFSSSKSLTMLKGIIAGTSCRDMGNVNTNSMRGVVLSGSSGSTTGAHTELGHNLPTGNFAKHYVNSALTTISDNVATDTGYSGLATIAMVGAQAKLFKNGEVVVTGGNQMAYTQPNTYLFIANGNVANNKLYESWIIFGNSETVAANLSSYLNK